MQFKSIQHLMCYIYVNTNITLFWEIIVIILKSFASVGIHLDHWEFTYLEIQFSEQVDQTND